MLSKPVAQSNRARCLRLGDFDSGFQSGFSHLVEDRFSSLSGPLIWNQRDPIGCYALKQVFYVNTIVLALSASHYDDRFLLVSLLQSLMSLSSRFSQRPKAATAAIYLCTILYP